MWIAWDDNELIINNDENLNDKITFKTKKEALDYISFRYLDLRKRLKVNIRHYICKVFFNTLV